MPMASSDGQQQPMNHTNITECEARELISTAFANKDLSKVAELAKTNPLIHQVFNDQVQELISKQSEENSKIATSTPIKSTTMSGRGVANSGNPGQYVLVPDVNFPSKIYIHGMRLNTRVNYIPLLFPLFLPIICTVCLIS